MSTQEVIDFTKELRHILTEAKAKDEMFIHLIMKTPLSTLEKSIKDYNVNDSDLFKDLKSSFSGNFKDLSVGLFQSQLERDCYLLEKNFNDHFIWIITSRSEEEVQMIQASYEGGTKKNFYETVKSNFKTIYEQLTKIIHTKRSTNARPDYDRCSLYAKELIQLLPDKWCSDSNIFGNIFAQSSPEELVIISRFFFKHTKKTGIEEIESNIKVKDEKELLRGILYNIINPSELCAEKLWKAMKGLGTDNITLNTIIASRCEIDMDRIKTLYEKKYKETLVEAIKGDTSGSYEDFCVALVNKHLKRIK